MKFVRLCAIALIIALACPLYSQALFLNIHPVAAMPQGDYKDFVKDFGFGFDGSFMMHIGDSPFWAGIEANAIFYNNSPTTFSTIDGPVENEPIKGAILGLLVLRTQITNETICPYFDTLIGFQHLFSKSGGVQGPVYGLVDDGSTFETNDRGQTLALGAGLGIMYHIFDYGHKKSDPSVKSIWLDCRARYLYGGETNYLTNYARSEDNSILFNTVKGNTSLLTLQIGVALEF